MTKRINVIDRTDLNPRHQGALHHVDGCVPATAIVHTTADVSISVVGPDPTRVGRRLTDIGQFGQPGAAGSNDGKPFVVESITATWQLNDSAAQQGDEAPRWLLSHYTTRGVYLSDGNPVPGVPVIRTRHLGPDNEPEEIAAVVRLFPPDDVADPGSERPTAVRAALVRLAETDATTLDQVIRAVQDRMWLLNGLASELASKDDATLSASIVGLRKRMADVEADLIALARHQQGDDEQTGAGG